MSNKQWWLLVTVMRLPIDAAEISQRVCLHLLLSPALCRCALDILLSENAINESNTCHLSEAGF